MSLSFQSFVWVSRYNLSKIIRCLILKSLKSGKSRRDNDKPGKHSAPYILETHAKSYLTHPISTSEFAMEPIGTSRVVLRDRGGHSKTGISLPSPRCNGVRVRVQWIEPEFQPDHAPDQGSAGKKEGGKRPSGKSVKFTETVIIQKRSMAWSCSAASCELRAASDGGAETRLR